MLNARFKQAYAKKHEAAQHEAAIVLRVHSLGKCYHIYKHPQDRLKQGFSRVFTRLVASQAAEAGSNNRKSYFSEFWALRDVSFQVRRGETIGILGRNGSGKSTLLQLISGVLRPTRGTMEINGRIAALLELGAGFNPEFSGRENVFINASIMGLKHAEIRNRLPDIIKFAELETFIDQPLKTYSSGMIVRLAFSVAVNVEPDILVIDEALSVGDEAFQRKCFGRIQEMQHNGVTILFVSHNGATIIELSDRAVLLDRGELLLQGVPKTVVTQYQRLIYAPPEKGEQLRNELRQGDFESESTAFITTEARINESNRNTSAISAWYDPEMTPSTTVRYEERGVHIHNAVISTGDGEQVNMLVPREEYVFNYSVRFSTSASKVRFGMLLKTISGLELGGGVSATPEATIDSVASGTLVKVCFRFHCALSSGTYFLNAGVSGLEDGGEVFLGRCIDVVMFKVLPIEENIVTGTVDFFITPSVSFR